MNVVWSSKIPSLQSSVETSLWPRPKLAGLSLSRLIFGLELRASLAPSFFNYFFELAVVTLQIFEAFFLFLRLFNRLGNKEAAVSASASMRGDRVGFFPGDREHNRVLLTRVPVAHLIEVEIAAVVSRYFSDFDSVLLDLAPHKVLLPEGVCAKLVGTGEVVGLVGEGHFT